MISIRSRLFSGKIGMEWCKIKFYLCQNGNRSLLNPLSNNKILTGPNWKHLQTTINATQMLRFVFDREENIVG